MRNVTPSRPVQPSEKPSAVPGGSHDPAVVRIGAGKESFYVLSGAVRLYDGRAWIEGCAGDFLFVPEGGIHGFFNDADEAASMLILFAPGPPARTTSRRWRVSARDSR